MVCSVLCFRMEFLVMCRPTSVCNLATAVYVASDLAGY